MAITGETGKKKVTLASRIAKLKRTLKKLERKSKNLQTERSSLTRFTALNKRLLKHERRLNKSVLMGGLTNHSNICKQF